MASFTLKSKQISAPICSSPKDSIPTTMQFEISDHELSLIPEDDIKGGSSSVLEELSAENVKGSMGDSVHEEVITDSIQPSGSISYEVCVDSNEDTDSLPKMILGTIPEELDSSTEIIESHNQMKQLEDQPELNTEEVPKESPLNIKQQEQVSEVDKEQDTSDKNAEVLKDENGEVRNPKEGYKPTGQYADLVQEMCEAFMPMLENIATTLLAPNTGLVHRVNSLQTFCEKVDGTVYTKKTGLVARMD